MKSFKPSILSLLLAVSYTASSVAENWVPVTGADTLKVLFSDTVLTGTIKKGVKGEARYNRDGTGELRAWGDRFERHWRIEGDNQVCIQIGRDWNCYSMEQSSDNQRRYRATNASSKEQVTFTIADGDFAADDSMPASRKNAARGAATKPSADEMARELANPNTPLASLNIKFQQRSFEGDIPGADSQDGTMVLFQPSLPFPTESGNIVFFRPAIPILIAQPVFQGQGDWDDESGIGDITFDLAVGSTDKETGILTAYGIISTLPTATKDELGADRYTLGPEILIGKLTKDYIIGAFPNHQWDIGGSGDADVNLTTVQLFGTLLPGGGWNYGSSPIMSFDHKENEWTVPLNFNFGKTVIRGGRPFKLSVEFNYYLEQPDAFGPEWMIGFTIAPVVKNKLAGWFK